MERLKGLSQHKNISATAVSVMGFTRNFGAGIATSIASFLMSNFYYFTAYLFFIIFLIIYLERSKILLLGKIMVKTHINKT